MTVTPASRTPVRVVRPASRVVIAGCGAATSVGLTTGAISAAVRGRLNCFTEHPWLRSARTGASIVAAVLEVLPPTIPYLDRIRELALAAVGEAIEDLESRRPGVPMPLLLSVPPRRPGVSPEALEDCVRRIGEAMPFETQRGVSAAFNASHASGLVALAHAVELIDRGVAGCCLVGGVDSWIDIDHLTWLEGDRRLKSPEVSTGLVPGEAASFVLVAREEVANEYSLKPLARVLALSFAAESAPWYAGNPTTGDAATAVFRTALDTAHVSGVATVADLNGESWRVDEWVLAYLRTGDRHRHPLHLEHPADCWGDVGAATGVLLASFVASEFRRRPDSGAVLISTASDVSPLRAACILAPYTEHVS